jgi:hypothetical protein
MIIADFLKAGYELGTLSTWAGSLCVDVGLER